MNRAICQRGPVRKILRQLLAGSLYLFSLQALAWNATGHREVVAVAWSAVSPDTRRAVENLLAAQNVIPGTRGLQNEEAWMAAALWPDELRADATSTAPLSAPRTNSQWLQRARSGEATRPWHFADRDIARPFSPQQPQGLLEQALSEQIRLLGDRRLSAEDRAIALAWVSHLVADAHQPLHTASRQDPARPGQLDAGGNTVTVLDAGRRPPEPLSLHRWWDELPGHARPGSTRFESEVARLNRQGAQISAPELAAPPLRWIEESFNIARDQLYPGLAPNPEQPGTFLISQDYWLEGRDITRARLALAGRRLADVIERALQDRH